MTELQSTIDKTGSTGQLFAVSPLTAATVAMATPAEGDGEQPKSPPLDGADDEGSSGECIMSTV